MGYFKAILLPYKNEAGLQQVKIEYRDGSDAKSRIRFKTGAYAKKSEWDQKNGRSKSDPSVNAQVQRILEDLQEVERRLVLQNKSATAEAVKSAYLDNKKVKHNNDKVKQEKEARNNRTLLEWFDEWIDYCERPENDLAKKTIIVRKQCREKLRKFNQPVTLPNLNKTYLEKFLNFLLLKEDLKPSSIGKHFSTLNTLVTWITDYEENQDIPIPSALSKLKPLAAYNDPVGLTRSEYIALLQVDLSFNKSLAKARDLFVIGVSTGGTRISDLKTIEFKNSIFKDGQYFVNYVETKTKTARKMQPIDQNGARILERYNYHLPRMSDKHFNACLKEIARYLNFDRMVEIHEFDLKGRIKKECSQKVPLYEIMSSKMMRKTFVSVSISLGIPTEVIMKSTGHKTHAAFGRYVDISLETQAEFTKKWNSIFSEPELNKLKI